MFSKSYVRLYNWFEEESSPCFPWGVVLVHIIKPIDDVEEGKDHGEEYAGPPIYGIHISQVGDGDFQLGGASPQAAFLLCHMSLQGISAKTMPG